MKITQLIYLPFWYLKNVILKGHNPLQTVLFVTDYCNLKCKHCFEMGHACTLQKTYDNIKEELEYSYKLGSRIVDFEGGEPTLWRENGKDINDLIQLAKDIGFFSCTVTTNAQMDISWVNADLIWISLDGYKEYHDAIRGEGAFEKLDRNAKLFAEAQMEKKKKGLKTCTLGANIAVNKINKDSVTDTLEYVKNSPYIQNIAVNFHTPYPGTEHMMLEEKDKCEVIDKVIALKKKHYPIQNSVSGLKMMKQKGFKKNCWVSNFIITDGTRFKTCPGETLGICDDCGFCMAGEMYCVMHLKPDTILSGLKLRL
ncbi:MAG: radical SAM protein [Lachnospiraceae bacterium]|nr:radical SAM protein [Lachnospiraceae bacterium]